MKSFFKYAFALLGGVLVVILVLIFLFSSGPQRGILGRRIPPVGEETSVALEARRLDSVISSSYFNLGLTADDLASVETKAAKAGEETYALVKHRVRLPSEISVDLVKDYLEARVKESVPAAAVSPVEESKDSLTLRVTVGEAVTHLLTFVYAEGQRGMRFTSISQRPRIAIVIEGLGQDLAAARAFVSLEGPLTLSVLPGEPLSVEVAEAAQKAGHEVILKLPLDSGGEVPEGLPSVSLLDMEGEKMIDQLRQYLAGVPYLKGVSNRAGSRLLSAREKTGTILKEVKEAGLYFLDARVTKEAVAFEMARAMGLASVERDIFLDDEKSREHIYQQLVKLSRLALREGSAVAIGSPHPITLFALRDNIPRLKERGFELVPLSVLVR